MKQNKSTGHFDATLFGTKKVVHPQNMTDFLIKKKHSLQSVIESRPKAILSISSSWVQPVAQQLTQLLSPLLSMRQLRSQINSPYTNKAQERQFLWRWMLVSLLFHILASWYSVGYQAADEHFQILEFLGYKLGVTPQGHLPIEFGEKMRPFTQVGLYWVIVRFWQMLGLSDPHLWAISLRLFTGGLGWLSCVGLAFCAPIWFKAIRAQRVFILALSLLWYFPVLHVRPSSESLAGTLFVLGLCTLLLFTQSRTLATDGPLKTPTASQSPLPEPLTQATRLSHDNKPTTEATQLKYGFLAGCFWGLSFEARFQMALMIVGALAWFLIINKTSILKLLSVLVGFFVVFGLGRVIDYWGYGLWVNSPWNYFSYNLIRGEVSRFGRSPWWDIYRMSITESWPLLGIGVSLAVTLAWIKYPKHLLTWCTFVFALVHMVIAHKEYRFFFPLAGPAAALLVLALLDPITDQCRWNHQNWQPKSRFQSLAKSTVRLVSPPLLAFLLLLNTLGLITLSVLPVSRLVLFQKIISEQITPGHNFDLYALSGDPFIILGNPTFFYRPKELNVIKIEQASQYKTHIENQQHKQGSLRASQKASNFDSLPIISPDQSGLATIENTDPTHPQLIWVSDSGFELSKLGNELFVNCRVIARSIPNWIGLFKPLGWLERIHVQTLYRCEPKQN